MSLAPEQLDVPPNGSTTVVLRAGTWYFVALGDVAPNCRINSDGSPDQVAEIPADSVSSVSFAIVCQPVFSDRLPAGAQHRIAFSALVNGPGAIMLTSSSDDGASPSTIVGRQGAHFHPSWSPDGKKIAFVSDWVAFDFVYDIYVADVTTETITQLTDGFDWWPNLLQYLNPAWSPDGSRLAMTVCPAAFYTCDVGHIVVMHADGTGSTVVAPVRGSAAPSWSPDGTTIAFSSFGNISWVRPGSVQRGFIVDSGHSPAWRPR